MIMKVSKLEPPHQNIKPDGRESLKASRFDQLSKATLIKAPNLVPVAANPFV
jgi:hypothetical protein